MALWSQGARPPIMGPMIRAQPRPPRGGFEFLTLKGPARGLGSVTGPPIPVCLLLLLLSIMLMIMVVKVRGPVSVHFRRVGHIRAASWPL